MTITVHCLPAPQGSKSYKGMSKKGHAILVESSKNVKPWRQAVCAAAIEAMGGAGKGYKGAVRVHICFTLPKPKSAPKRRTIWPDKKPDLSKLIRSTEDALVDAGVIEDDARIIEILAAKYYPNEGQLALAVPGAAIFIWPHPLLEDTNASF